MSDYGLIGVGLDYGSSFAQGSVGNYGLASGNGLTFANGTVANEGTWGLPGQAQPLTNLNQTYGPVIKAPDFTSHAIDFNAQHFDAAGNSDFGKAANGPDPANVPETLLPYQPPTFGGFVGWVFGDGN